jgi:hypothetical protein
LRLTETSLIKLLMALLLRTYPENEPNKFGTPESPTYSGVPDLSGFTPASPGR